VAFRPSLRVAGVRWWLPAGAEAAALGPLVARVPGALAASAGNLKRGRRKALYPLDLAGRGFPDHLLKVSRYPGWRGVWRRWRGTKARRELRVAEALRARGVPALVPRAAGEVRRLGRVSACWLLVERDPGLRPLDAAAADGAAAPRARRERAAALGRLLARAHAAGLDQDDPAPNNVLVREPDPDALWLVDFERARLRRRVGRRARARALAKLDRWAAGAVPATQRLRFLRAYAGGEAAAARRGWRAVAAAAPRLARRDLRRLRRAAHRAGARAARPVVGPGFRGLAAPGVSEADAARAARAARGAPPFPAAPARIRLARGWLLATDAGNARQAGAVWARAVLRARRGEGPEPRAVLRVGAAFWLWVGEAADAPASSDPRLREALGDA